MSEVNMSASNRDLLAILEEQLKYTLCVSLSKATRGDIFNAVALAIRHFQQDQFLYSQARQRTAKKKRVYYLSMEFLLGQSLRNNLMNMNLLDDMRQVVNELGFDFDNIFDEEPDAALGNGGLGRLAACFLDSMATLDIAASGHGIKYEYGLFRQSFQNEQQVEHPDDWHSMRSPWLVEHYAQAMLIPIGGYIEHAVDADGNYNPMWMGWNTIVGIPNDYFVSGYRGSTTNKLRLYSAVASNSFNIHIFNRGDYIKAVSEKIASENISKILYPSDEILTGKELRLTQEYFLVACSLRDMFREYAEIEADISLLPHHVAIQLNDTHPALAVVELMRTLVDEYSLPWSQAWDITQKICAYTNHTLMPEALETWPVALFEKLLPRHLQIIFEINRRFLDDIANRWPDKPHLLTSLSLFAGDEDKQIRMANLAIVGSHCVNGVAMLHSELIKTHLVPDFYFITPEKFINQTNGVTPRRWLQQANPNLATFLNQQLGAKWPMELQLLRQLEKKADDAGVIDQIRAIKFQNKSDLSQIVSQRYGITFDPMAMFDCQVKRIHEYKRQLLNILHVISLYLDIKDNGKTIAPKVHLFAGKAAPGYRMAKLIIQLINTVAKKINSDPRIAGQLKVVFLEDYKVSLAESIIPATDLSEQISTAGTEASGTSNMKFALNGALTIGTYDGANIEICEAVGKDNFYLFGATAEEVNKNLREGENNILYHHGNSRIAHIVDTLISGMFTPDHDLFAPLHHMLTTADTYCHLLDFESYCQMQQQAMVDFEHPRQWHRKALLNISRMGEFSSDRTIQGYAKDIWGINC
ncbi:glycogen/starch/alpha-glucan phosphorylase [Salmonella enterica]|nr:glycogen/starch/alpha-glucan phosphorylase [Salmonella enterica]EIJ7608550.1 glycogen/starch/alpha-glucan phosphorylase [Salmonella enterica]